MNEVIVIGSSNVTEADASAARLGGPRFGRLDALSRLALVAVDKLGINFDPLPRERIGVCLVARAGSLSTDVEFWNGRDAVGGPSPTLFAYTLPSSAIGEIAIRYRLMGPNLCFTGEEEVALTEAADLIRRGEAAGCLCVSCQLLTPAAAEMSQLQPVAHARALFLAEPGLGLPGTSFETFRASLQKA